MRTTTYGAASGSAVAASGGPSSGARGFGALQPAEPADRTIRGLLSEQSVRAGVRYTFQVNPGAFGNLLPRESRPQYPLQETAD